MKAWVYGSLDTILRDAHITSFTVDTEQPGNYYVTTEIEVLPAAEYEKMEDVIKMLEHACGGAAQGYPAAEEAQVALAALARLRALGKG